MTNNCGTEQRWESTLIEQTAVSSVLERSIDGLIAHLHAMKRTSMRTVQIFYCITSEMGCAKSTQVLTLEDDVNAELQDLQEQAKFEKLWQDGIYVVTVFEKLMESVRKGGDFGALVQEIENTVVNEKEENTFIKETKKMVQTAAKLRKEIVELRRSHEADKKRLTDILSELQIEREKLKLIVDIKREYVDDWERARYEQNELRRQIDLRRLRNTLQECIARAKIENRITDAKIQYLVQRETAIEDEIEYWQRRYHCESETYQREIRQMRSEIESFRSNLMELMNEYRSKQEFIDMYLAEKEAIKKQKEYETHVRESAIRIQAWWRGVMVRRKLGPYRPQEKKKKKPLKPKK